MKPRILISGGTGFLGGHLIRKANAGWHTHGTFFRTQPSQPCADWHGIDLSNLALIEELIDRIKPSVVIHAAALANLDYCERNPSEAHAINYLASEKFADACTRHSIRFIFISTDMVYDGARGNYPESDLAAPTSVYGRSKIAAESAVNQRGGNFVIARIALNYGRPAAHGTSFSEWLDQRLRAGQNVPLFTDQFRSPILVDNLADLLLELAQNNFIGTINLGGPERMDRYTFGLKYCQICGLNPDLLQPLSMADLPQDAPRPRDVSMNTTRAQRLLKTRLLTIEEGIKQLKKLKFSDCP